MVCEPCKNDYKPIAVSCGLYTQVEPGNHVLGRARIPQRKGHFGGTCPGSLCREYPSCVRYFQPHPIGASSDVSNYLSMKKKLWKTVIVTVSEMVRRVGSMRRWSVTGCCIQSTPMSWSSATSSQSSRAIRYPPTCALSPPMHSRFVGT